MIQDFKFALRQLVKAPGFTIAAVTVLALGIGANTAVFSLVHTMLFASPGYAQPAEVLQIYSQDKKDPKNFRGFSYPTYLDIRQQNTAFEDVMGYHLSMVGVGEKGTPRRAMAGIVSANYFSVLGVAPALGRAFLSEEETPRRGTRVAVVSDGFWKKRGRNAAILGSEVILNGRPFTIVGVMPKGFTGTMHMFGSEVWVPFGVREEVMDEFARDGGTTFGERAGKELMLVGRLKSGVTAEAAQPVLKGIAANLEGAYPVEQKDQTFLAAPLRRFGTSTSPSGEKAVSMLGGLLLGMSGIVLLVACLNLANMLLARGTARRKEIAIRLALGAARGRIIRQLLTEGFVLAVVGGAFGIVLALWSSDLLMGSLGRMLPIDIIYIGGPNLSLIAATLAFCFVGTLCFALGPALKLSRVTLVDDLKEQAGEDVVARRWKFMPRNPLVVVQFAFSLALVTAAALFVRGAGKAADVDTGLQTDRTFLVELDASLGGYDRARSQEVYRAVGEKLSSLPGVEASSISGTVPFGMLSLSKRVLRAGLQPAADAKPATAADGLAFRASWRSVGADYFKTTHLPLLRGRAFTAAEALSGGPAVAIIDEILAKKLWPDGDALGQRVQVYRESTEPTTVESPGDIEPGESIQIIGIAAHTREAFFGQEPESAIYVPFARAFQSNSYFFVKFASLPAGSEANAADLLRRTVSSVDASLPVLSIKTFDQHLNGNLQLWLIKAAAALFSVFGALALGLSVVGLYGVKAYSVARRTREIGIRMALGAQRSAVQRMILREGSSMLATGLVLGLLLAFAVGKLVSSILYEVSALDPVAFTVAPVVLGIAGLLATWLPARRATRISPMAALRTE
ncbi:MAG: ABC transporter permease [Chthoniobacterales bacterium]|nr:ABC transporter permease [Chthoniobacterales bacterium]